MRIAELFRSIQGEGFLTGTESLFVRLSGCNLRCRWCDTPYASWAPEGDDLSVDEVLARLEQLERPADPSAGDLPRPVGHAVLTGGEPMLFAELIPLSAALRRRGKHVTIETSGTLYLPVECDLMSISPKLSNSTPTPDSDPRWRRRHEANRHAPEVIRRLVDEHPYQVKFVVDCPEDLREIEAYLAEFPQIDRARTMLMPQGIGAEELAAKGTWLSAYCVESGLAFCPRRQIEWFGTRRGT